MPRRPEVSLHEPVPQPVVTAIDVQLALDVLAVFAARLTQAEILASQVLDDEREPGRHMYEHPTLRDGRGRALRVDPGRLRAYREPKGFEPTAFDGSASV